MPDNLSSGTFKIVSLLDGNPLASVTDFRLPSQHIRLDSDVTTWVAVKERVNDVDVYRLRVGGYCSTGVIADKVVDGEDADEKVEASSNAHQNEPWIATYQKSKDAYTIALANNRGKLLWTVSSDSKLKYRVIKIKPIIPQPESGAQTLSNSQLFRFEPVPVTDPVDE